MGRPGRRYSRYPVVIGATIAALFLLASVGSSQVPPVFQTPSPPPETPEPTLTPPPPSGNPATPTPRPVPSDVPLPEDETLPTETKKPADPKDGEVPDADEVVDDELPPGLEGDFPLEVPLIARTPARNTVRLVNLLRPLTASGLTLEQVLVEGMGRFPVAGLAHYSDDWLNPRYTPEPHLHKGLDIFADFGTPIRSPDKGVVTRISNGPTGGLGVWTRGTDGTSYYFAHLLEIADGLKAGQRVDIGTVLGYVGDSGNARGGTPHLHFQIHPGGGEPVPPKPSVDAWLDEAEELAPKYVAARKAQLRGGRGVKVAPTATHGVKKGELETSMLLTLLDPVGGSVGMLPNIGLSPRGTGAVSDRLLKELIRQRVQGQLFVPSSHVHLYD